MQIDLFVLRFQSGETVRRIDFADSLPREDSGKIFKRKLREPFWEGRERRI